jgi:calcineurin-like phosphoesterase family protein
MNKKTKEEIIKEMDEMTIRINDDKEFNKSIDNLCKLGKRDLYNPQRIIAVGDVHGRLDHLNLLLDKILPLKEGDHLVFLGDLVNRGNNSLGVLFRIMEIQKQYKNQVFCILGNHDSVLKKYLKTQDKRAFYPLIEQTILEFKHTFNGDLFECVKNNGILDFFNSFIPYYETKTAILTHAPINFDNLISFGFPNVEYILDSGIDLRWENTNIDDDRVDVINKFKICGHQVVNYPKIFNHRAFIDTGCGFDGKLSALIYPELKIIQSL